jgi:hypothetical protein
MNDTTSRSQESFERHGPPPKKGCGCLVNTLIGLAVFAIAIVAAAWLLIMHTSLPLRFVTKLIEEGGADSKLKITGVSGSLSSGLSFKNVKWDEGEITDMRFRYSGIMDVIRRKELIIHEMHVGSATLQTTFFTESPEEPETQSNDHPTPKGESKDPPLRLLQIDRVSLNQIIIKNPTNGNTITIPKIEWTGFKAEKGAELELGNLEADSDHLVIKTTTPPDSDYQKRVEVSLLPKLHPSILKPIRIDAYFGQKDGKPFSDIKAFDESVHFIQTADGSQQLRATGANLADFLDAPLPNQLQLDAELANPDSSEPTLTVRGSSFVLGTKSFAIQPTTVTGPEEAPAGTGFLAICRKDDTEIRYEIPVTQSKDQQQSFTPVLTSTPAMKAEDLMALLFHDGKFSDLPPSDQEKLRKHMSWFSFSLSE